MTAVPNADPAGAPIAPQRQGRLLAALERLLGIDALELEPALHAAADLLADLFAADKVDVFLLEEQTTTLIAVGTSRTPMGAEQRRLGLHRLPLANRGRIVETFETGITYCNGRVHEDQGVLVGIRESLGVRSMVACAFAAPDGVLSGERQGGVLLLSSAQPDFFSETDVPFFEAVARWTGLIVHRGRLAERVRTQAVDAARRLAAEELVTVLAHDLRNCLAPLKTRLQLLQRDARRDGQPGYVDRAAAVLRDTARLESLVSDLLDVSRLERGVFVVYHQPTDLLALARETAAAMTGETVAVHAGGDDPVDVSADPARVRQALENLIANAIQHSPPDAAVRVLAAQEQDPDGARWAVLSVHDDGPGIPAEQLPALFTRFGAGAGSVGLGLGLYISRRIAEAHGGEVTVDTAPDAGTTFFLRLPITPPA